MKTEDKNNIFKYINLWDNLQHVEGCQYLHGGIIVIPPWYLAY